jgi:DNA-directed RNA polymerase specialized sigma24 family protein
VSPLTLRRYRAERLLREQFEALRGRVIATVRARLGAAGANLDSSDLDACYAQAWQGLYAAVLEGREIANPGGWLTLVTFRRAIEELRAQRPLERAGRGHSGGSSDTAGAPRSDGAEDPDFAAELDDRAKLRQLFEGLRGRLSAREREAASFCYLQGLSRSEAAVRMGISEARMRKLMDGQGAGRPGVAGKVGRLAATIRDGGWCEEQGSLMRGLAYGILDPDGERYRLALIHRSECPACRAYVVSLRGLAAALPPVLLPWGLGAGALARAGGHAHASAIIGAHPGAGVQAGAEAGASAGGGIGGAMTASGAAGAGGAAGGSWILAGGSLGTKLAVGCVLALGVGAGCVALTDPPAHVRAPPHRGERARASRVAQAKSADAADLALSEGRAPAGVRGGRGAADGGSGPTPSLTPAARAAREFGLERPAASGDGRSASSSGPETLTATRASAAGAGRASGGSSSSAAPAQAAAPLTRTTPSRTRPAAVGTSAAEREFGIG